MNMPESAACLSIRNLSVVLGGAAVLDSVSTQVKPGQVVGLIGPNGAGKSSLIRATLGLLEYRTGDIDIDGTAAGSLSARARAKKIAYLPQKAPVNWPLNAERLVGLGRIPHLGPWQTLSAEDHAKVRTAMEATDTWDLRQRTATSLSGGEMARLVLARAIAVDAPYLLADEPTASLDPYHQLQVMEIMRSLAQQGTGIMIVLHDLTLAANHCDRLILLNEGKLIQDGAPNTVLTEDNLRETFNIAVARWQDGENYFLQPVAPLSR